MVTFLVALLCLGVGLFVGAVTMVSVGEEKLNILRKKNSELNTRNTELTVFNMSLLEEMSTATTIMDLAKKCIRNAHEHKKYTTELLRDWVESYYANDTFAAQSVIVRTSEYLSGEWAPTIDEAEPTEAEPTGAEPTDNSQINPELN